MSVAHDCPCHKEHEYRIGRLEGEMTEVQTHIKKSAMNVALISLVGVVFTAFSSFAGYVFIAFAKSRGWL